MIARRRMQCYPNDAIFPISITDGLWGDWTDWSQSCGEYIIGARLRLEADQGSGGDGKASSILIYTCTQS